MTNFDARQPLIPVPPDAVALKDFPNIVQRCINRFIYSTHTKHNTKKQQIKSRNLKMTLLPLISPYLSFRPISLHSIHLTYIQTITFPSSRTFPYPHFSLLHNPQHQTKNTHPNQPQIFIGQTPSNPFKSHPSLCHTKSSVRTQIRTAGSACSHHEI